MPLLKKILGVVRYYVHCKFPLVTRKRMYREIKEHKSNRLCELVDAQNQTRQQIRLDARVAEKIMENVKLRYRRDEYEPRKYHIGITINEELLFGFSDEYETRKRMLDFIIHRISAELYSTSFSIPEVRREFPARLSMRNYQ